MSEAAFTFEYSLYSRRGRGVYLPVTLTAGNLAAHLVVRVDCASTYCVLGRPWAEYFGLAWDSGDPSYISAWQLGGFQAYLHVLGSKIDRFAAIHRWRQDDPPVENS